ncbi:DUF47 family protein [Aquitalea sp. S1-19]|nr:DUF47 family protein [Aquitalea sp. S1-19]
MQKTDAVASLGESSLLLPGWITAALAANDRLKLYLSLMQAVIHAVDHGEDIAIDWQREFVRLGLQSQAWLAALGHGAYRQGDAVFVPRLGEWLDALDRDLHALARPVCGRPEYPAPALKARCDAWHARLEALADAEEIGSGLLHALTHGDRKSGDSLHLLVMDLHKAINTLAGDVATEEIDGAHVWQIRDEDRPRVQAFMRGLHSTSALKFGHPGLDTAVTRDGDRLLLQNDIGTNDAHVLVIEWTPDALHLTYSDLHPARFEFFAAMLRPLGFDWASIAPGMDAALNAGKSYLVGHASLQSDSESRLAEALEGAASRIVFVIDWNRARKRLQHFVRKPVAVGILEQLARENLGHMAWLLAGGELLVYDAMQSMDGGGFRVGDRLDRVLGEASAREYLYALMREASIRLREQQPVALVADEARLLLARAMRKRAFEFDLLAEQAAYCHALAQTIVEMLLEQASPAGLQQQLARAKAWERQADHLLVEARQRSHHFERWQPMLGLLERMDDVADVLEEAVFVLGLLLHPGMPLMPAEVNRHLSAIAELTLGAIQDQVKVVEIARHLEEGGAQRDGDEFLKVLWRIVRAERACDEALRMARWELVGQWREQAAALQMAVEFASNVEQATDRLLEVAYVLRSRVLEQSGVQS